MHLIMASAFAASKFGKPVRAVLDRDEDMLLCGDRHPFLSRYRVGYTKDGLVKAIDADLYCNAGFTLDLSFSVIHRYVKYPTII